MDLRRPWSYKFLEVCPISPYEDMANVLEIIEKAKIEAIDACVCPSETKAVPTKKKGKPHARV